MKVVISAHMDLARPTMSINLNEKKLFGLIDNFAGVFISYQTSRKTGVPVYFTNYEELDYDGAQFVAKGIDKETVVIVVDTILESDIKGKQVSITNAYGLDEELKDLQNKFKDKIHFIDGLFEETEDETWIYGNKNKLKTFYFGVPIPGDYYHSTELEIGLDTIDRVAEILTEVVEWFMQK
ncbi:MAG: hypothetical protein COU25_00955 [Candidatus Levybacteria bacterium CG10_big_fil_rev_8_21_14_0_10_35_13]|nr:MAG: hypothetical protein COU25_00955 [Candidatus Levybacteria bacterium CG10_big_fil_rev_8_21_14_0_10_35_13]